MEDEIIVGNPITKNRRANEGFNMNFTRNWGECNCMLNLHDMEGEITIGNVH